ncbi:hypothetical protein ABT332_13530 [Saccharomonospora azurea]|uniref:hypothetical protein n=1 Tax=Saccharomonospora azurea TaxID=40988 RepID=UPI00331C0FDE
MSTITRTDMTVVKQFNSGARVLDVDGTAQIGITATGRVYWANPEGWDWVLANAERRGYVVGGTEGWPTVDDTDFYIH